MAHAGLQSRLQRSSARLDDGKPFVSGLCRAAEQDADGEQHLRAQAGQEAVAHKAAGPGAGVEGREAGQRLAGGHPGHAPALKLLHSNTELLIPALTASICMMSGGCV